MRRLKDRLCKKEMDVKLNKVETISHHGNTVQTFKE